MEKVERLWFPTRTTLDFFFDGDRVGRIKIPKENTMGNLLKDLVKVGRAIDRINKQQARSRATAEREYQRRLREQARRDREMERARAAAARESERIQRDTLRGENREHREARKRAFEAEKKEYEKRIKARQILRMSFLAKVRNEEKDTL
jgi:hypothetical protein